MRSLAGLAVLSGLILAGWPGPGTEPGPVPPGANAAAGPAQLAPPAAAGPADANAPATNATLPSLWFPVGEELHYHILWGNMVVGRVTILTAWAREADRPLLKVAYWARSNRALSKIYPVQDLIVAVIDPVTFRPVRFDVNLREGKYHRKETTVFDHRTKTATWASAVKNKVRTFPIEDDTRDLLTFMYYMRSKGFRPGTNLLERVMADDKVYDLHVQAAGDEIVELPRYGKVTCLRLDPTAEFEGIFVRSGKMSLWVSKDSRNLCTKVEAEVPVGSVQAVLSRVRGPGDDFWIRHGSETNTLPYRLPDE